MANAHDIDSGDALLLLDTRRIAARAAIALVGAVDVHARAGAGERLAAGGEHPVGGGDQQEHSDEGGREGAEYAKPVTDHGKPSNRAPRAAQRAVPSPPSLIERAVAA